MARGHALALALAVVPALGGCQSYTPRPLDAAAHRASWQARLGDGASLGPFLERLELDVGREAAELDLADGVSLREGQLVALAFNPDLRLARLRAARELAGAEHAGLLADPELSFEVLRVTESVPDRWVVAPGLSFSIPLSGRPGAERDLAAARLAAAEAAVLAAEWSVRHEVERAWIEWSAALVRAEETRRFVDSMDQLVRTVSALAERGELRRTEATLFRFEQAHRRNQLHGLDGEIAAARQRLHSLLGLVPEAPVELVPALGGAADRELPRAGAPDAIEARNPSLARLRREYEASEEALRREVVRQYPDLTLGPLFESDLGQSRVGLLGALPLPFLNANRRAIAEATVDRELARAAYETAYETLVGRHAAASARSSALAVQRVGLERTLAPMLDGQLADALELLRLGEGTTLVLLESLTRAHRSKLDLVETRSAEAAARAEVAFLVGPEVARETPEATEPTP